MSTHLISDDYYFSLGLKSCFADANEILHCHSWTAHSNPFHRKHLLCGDTVLLDACTPHFVGKIITSPIFDCRVNVIIFPVNKKTFPGIFSAPNFMSKKMPLTEFSRLVSNLSNKYPNLQDCRGKLTLQESIIMCRLYQQASYHDISQELSISQKTVSSHKVNALRKLGVRNFGELYAYGAL